MKIDASLERVRSYMDCQLQSETRMQAIRAAPSGPTITFSRETGSGAHSIAEKLAAYLDRHGPPGNCGWTVFDRSLVDKVLEEHQLPRDLARYLPEDRRSYLDDVMEELLGLHPPSWTFVRQSVETILHLAELGRVILIGRGSHVITARMPNVFHVRLVASLEKRIQQTMEWQNLSRKEAEKFVHDSDRGRARYLKTHFQVSIDDVLQYHLVINTDRIHYDDAAELIGATALKFFS